MKSIEVKSVTPLGIIALFLALTEIVLTVAATQSSGVTQIILVTFVVSFPVVILGLFFLILWRKPYVFYSPKEYEGGADVKEYVSALHMATTEKKPAIAEAQSLIPIRDAQISNKPEADQTPGGEEDWQELAKHHKYPEARDALLKKIAQTKDEDERMNLRLTAAVLRSEYDFSSSLDELEQLQSEAPQRVEVYGALATVFASKQQFARRKVSMGMRQLHHEFSVDRPCLHWAVWPPVPRLWEG